MLCSTEVKHTKVMLTFFQDQNLRCPKGEVPLYVVFISPCWPESILAYSQTHLPLIHVKPCFTGDVLNICTRARAKILVWPWKHRCKHKLKPKNKDKILLACVLVSVLLHNTLTLHSLNNIQLWKSWLSTLRGNRTWQQANPTNFQRMGGWVGQSALLLCTDMRMSGDRILCHYLLSPPGTFIPQPGYFLCPLSTSMPFGVLAFTLCFQALWILLIFTNDNVLDWLVKIRLYSVSWVDEHYIFHLFAEFFGYKLS